VHGKLRRYINLTKECEYSVQIGDMGFHYWPLVDENIDPTRHKFFGGNHDDYDILESEFCPSHCLGDFGAVDLGGIRFFFVRGGFSIDRAWRTRAMAYGEPKCWWAQEELPEYKLDEARELYRKVKPDLVLTHEPPRSICDLLGNPEVLRSFGHDPKTFTTRTSIALERMFAIHQPKQWIFGHFHKSWSQKLLETRFICLDELEYLDIPIY